LIVVTTLIDNQVLTYSGLMMKPIRALLLVCSAAALVACGGGSGSSGDAADKYAGTWKGCQPTGVSAAPYSMATIVLAKTGASTLNGTFQLSNTYSNAGCSAQISSVSVTYPYSASIVDSVSVQGNSVDRVNTVLNGTAIKDIYYTSGTFLYLGGGTVLDAAGYPAQLALPLAKQ
jgi:hypothetical protein